MSSGETDYSIFVEQAATSVGYVLKQEQANAIKHFVIGNDVFISLPTGYGKSLCFLLLPRVFDLLKAVPGKFIILVVSPLPALMKDQVSSANALGLSAAMISDRESTPISMKNDIKKGNYQIIFISPEALFVSIEWRNVLSSDVFQNNLVGFVVDEAHCVKKLLVIIINNYCICII